VQGEAATALARAKLNLKSGMLTDRQTLLVTTSISDTSRHFGSRIAFDDDHVFFTVGDRGVRENGQDLKNHAGTVIRLKRDGSVPDDNPFVGDGAALDEIWSYGHRNAQGIAFDSEGRLWGIEHGPRGGDELNLISKGENYGWPVVSQGKEYWGPFDVGVKQKEGMQPAAKVYVPSIAPGSLISVISDKYGWKDDLLSGALKLTHLNRIVMQDGKPAGEERYFEERGQRLRALLEDTQGVIWIATDAGELWRLNP
jgi:glucose/arabinose dehydrogenase